MKSGHCDWKDICGAIEECQRLMEPHDLPFTAEEVYERVAWEDTRCSDYGVSAFFHKLDEVLRAYRLGVLQQDTGGDFYVFTIDDPAGCPFHFQRALENDNAHHDDNWFE